MIAYLKCLCTSKDKALAKKLRQAGYTVKVTRNSKQIRDEAKQYQQSPPFLIDAGGMVHSL